MFTGYFFFIIQILLFSAIYVVAARFGLSLSPISTFATYVWIPTGLSLVLLYLFGFRFWPAIALGALVANFFTGAPFVTALGIAFGNTMEAVLGAYFLQRGGFRSSLNRLRDVVLLLFVAAGVSTIISATIGVGTLVLTNVITSSVFLHTWVAWWLGDMLSDLIIASLFFVWVSKPSLKLDRKEIFEGGILAICLCFISFIMFRGLFGMVPQGSPIAYLIFPFLLWIAVRFGQRGTVTAVFVVSAIALWGTLDGFGPFVQQTVSQSLLFVQGFVSVSAIMSMILSSVVSERKELEERKDDFISMASHELKTPVTSMKLYTQLLQKEFAAQGNTRAQTIFSKFNGQIDRLNGLISDLLDISRITAGKLAFREGMFDITAVVKEIVTSLAASEVHHTIQVKGQIKGLVYGDSDRIGQVFINLLTNAIKYSPDSKKIIVRLRKQKKTVVVSVQDFGIGISKEQRERIFDRFYQAANAHEGTYPGLGIGLYIASQIIKRHRGRISVESIEGKGSTFTFTLPQAD